MERIVNIYFNRKCLTLIKEMCQLSTNTTCFSDQVSILNRYFEENKNRKIFFTVINC